MQRDFESMKEPEFSDKVRLQVVLLVDLTVLGNTKV